MKETIGFFVRTYREGANTIDDDVLHPTRCGAYRVARSRRQSDARSVGGSIAPHRFVVVRLTTKSP